MDDGSSSAREGPPDDPAAASNLLSASLRSYDTIISRASSPMSLSAGPGSKPGGSGGAGGPRPTSSSQRDVNPQGKDDRRYRPRTFSYMSLLPFPVELVSARDAALRGILRELYIAVKAEDHSPGALFWSRQLQNWLQLKFEMPRTLRATLTKMYYHLALAPGLDSAISERFVSMVVILTR